MLQEQQTELNHSSGLDKFNDGNYFELDRTRAYDVIGLSLKKICVMCMYTYSD